MGYYMMSKKGTEEKIREEIREGITLIKYNGWCRGYEPEYGPKRAGADVPWFDEYCGFEQNEIVSRLTVYEAVAEAPHNEDKKPLRGILYSQHLRYIEEAAICAIIIAIDGSIDPDKMQTNERRVWLERWNRLEAKDEEHVIATLEKAVGMAGLAEIFCRIIEEMEMQESP